MNETKYSNELSTLYLLYSITTLHKYISWSINQLIKRGHVFKSPENLKLCCKMRSQILVNIVNWIFLWLRNQKVELSRTWNNKKVFLPTTLCWITSLSKWREKNGQKTRQKVPLRWVISSSYHIPSCLGENVAGSNKRKLEEAKGEKKKKSYLVFSETSHPTLFLQLQIKSHLHKL